MGLLDEISPFNPTQREIPAFPRELLAYLPPVIREADEMGQIMAAEQPEVFALYEAAQRALDEQFIGTMSDYGVRRWEKILRVTPLAADTLDTRKERVLSYLRVRLPYTLRWLQQWLLESLGAGNYRLEIDRYTIVIELYVSRWPEGHPVHLVHLDVLELLGWIKPANMIMKIIRAFEFFKPLYLHALACETMGTTLPPAGRRREHQRTLYFSAAAYEQVDITLRPTT